MQTPPSALKVMTFNIRFGTAEDGENSWAFRKEAVIDYIGSSGYDVIGLQEALAHQLHDIREALPYYHFVGVGRDDGIFGGELCAILFDSRRVTFESTETFWFSDTPDVVGSSSWGNSNVRICTHASFLIDGQPFEHYNLHIDHDSAISRLNSIELLIDRIRTRGIHLPTIVTGDFNEGEAGPCYPLMLAAGFKDSYRALNAEGPEQGTYHGWSKVTDGQKIDYVFVSEHLPVVDGSIIRETPYGRYLSDHYPVVATVDL